MLFKQIFSKTKFPFKSLIIISIGIIILVFSFSVRADRLRETLNFFVDPSRDLENRSQISASLQQITTRIYFYAEDNWWDSLDYKKQNQVRQSLLSLGNEFYYKIYPEITSTFGEEWSPGIDEKNRITVLIHQMKGDNGGYFRNNDEYSKLQLPTSNEREMIYLNARYVENPLLKSLLSHEFIHLVTFNQKEKKQNIEEEVWLNEARAEYAPTFLGYDDQYQDSNLQNRVKIFLNSPSDPITEWQGEKADYGALNLFTQYLVEHYGIGILADSLKSNKVGIDSINGALEKSNFNKTFSQIFTDWTIALLVNDCSLEEKYCYKNENLKDLRINPQLLFLPFNGQSNLDITQNVKDWSAIWLKIIGGGKGSLKIKFINNSAVPFEIPYIFKDISGKYSINFLKLDKYQQKEVSISDFNTKVYSVTFIPLLKNKKSGFLNPEPSFSFSISASVVKETEQEKEFSKYLEKPISEMSKEELQTKINTLEELITLLKESLKNQQLSCQKFEYNLFYGQRNNNEVKCLQSFLKDQGTDIYPEGLVTGNFLSLTKAAVIRFQEKYASEILKPLDLGEGTGFFGLRSRAKVNELLGT